MTRTRWWGRVFGVLSQLAGIGLLLTSAWMIVRAAEMPPVLYLMVAIVGVRFFGFARACLRYVERLFIHDAALTTAVETRVAVRDHVDRIAPRALTGHRSGDLVSRVVSDVDRTVDREVRLVPLWISAVCSVLVVAAVLAWIESWFGLVVLATSALALVAARVIVPRSTASGSDDVVRTEGRLAAVSAEAVRSAPDLVVLGATRATRDEVRRNARQLAAAQTATAFGSGLGTAVVLVLTGVAMAVLAAGTMGLDPVLVGVVVLAPLALVEPLDAVVDAERLRPAIASARARLDELESAADPIADHTADAPVPTRWDLSLEGVVVGWDHGVTAPVDLELPQGSVVAVTGPSGVGKTTLALTLARLLDPVAGTVRLGGVDVTRLDPVGVRGIVGYLGQDDVVLDTTLAENLRIARPDATDEAMHEALARAGLTDFVHGLRDGLETRLGEGGRRTSGGERRRLSLARMLLAGHRVLVADEPTEHLDADTAHRLLDDLVSLAPSRTLVLASHDPRVLAAADQVVEVHPALVTRAPCVA